MHFLLFLGKLVGSVLCGGFGGIIFSITIGRIEERSLDG